MLLKVAPVFRIDEYKVQIVLHRKLMRAVLVRGRKVKARHEEADRNALSPDGCAVHKLVFDKRFTLVVLLLARARLFAPNDVKLHVFDLDPDKQKVHLSYDDILKVVPGAGREKREKDQSVSRQTMKEGRKTRARTFVCHIQTRCEGTLQCPLPS